MINSKRYRVVFAFVLFAAALGWVATPQIVAQTGADKDRILKASDITPKIFPDKVFYRGQVAPVQMRNTGGVRFADEHYVIAGLVDNAGYSSGVREKYQGYFITEVTLEVNGQSLKPGAYGIGFLSGAKFVVTDLGSNTVVEAAGKHDAELKRPVPLQILAGSEAGSYRLYLGRDFVEFKRAQ